MPAPAERYLKPEVIQTVSRLDLRARFIVEGFMAGLHASPFHGFSVEFSEHRRYAQGDDPKDIDWQAYAKTDRLYVKKYQAETNITGWLLVDLSESMGYTHEQTLTKLDYSICLAAAMAYLMIGQQDPVGLVTFGEELRASLPARSKRKQLGDMLAVLAAAKPTGGTDVGGALKKVAAMAKHRGLMMLFSDLLTDREPVLEGLRRLRHAGHDVIVFHVLDAAEVDFPFTGTVDLTDPEGGENLVLDAAGMRAEYAEALAEFRGDLETECRKMGADFVPLHTGQQFDKALIEYLSHREARF